MPKEQFPGHCTPYTALALCAPSLPQNLALSLSIAFALEMYIPFELNAPILAGALVGEMVKKYAKSQGEDEKGIEERYERGTMVATGFMAGGALFGVVAALLKSFGIDLGEMAAKAFNLYTEENRIWQNTILQTILLFLLFLHFIFSSIITPDAKNK